MGRRGPKSDRGERLQSGTELSDGSSAPAAKMARTDGGSGSQACLNGGSKSAQSVAADDENYRVSPQGSRQVSVCCLSESLTTSLCLSEYLNL